MRRVIGGARLCGKQCWKVAKVVLLIKSLTTESRFMFEMIYRQCHMCHMCHVHIARIKEDQIEQIEQNHDINMGVNSRCMQQVLPFEKY
jgi:hypothetical protein